MRDEPCGARLCDPRSRVLRLCAPDDMTAGEAHNISNLAKPALSSEALRSSQEMTLGTKLARRSLQLERGFSREAVMALLGLALTHRKGRR